MHRGMMECFLVALKLGLTSFGGPVAHLGFFREAYVERLKWLGEERYAELLAVTQFLPGPASSQLGAAIGYERAGWSGGFAAWLGFTLPSALVMMGFGGVRLEAERDVVFALPPFDASTARRRLGKLRQQDLLTYDRGAGKPDLVAFCDMAARFSAAVAALSEVLLEVDMNPVLVHADGCVALDALVVGAGENSTNSRKAS